MVVINGLYADFMSSVIVELPGAGDHVKSRPSSNTADTNNNRHKPCRIAENSEAAESSVIMFIGTVTIITINHRGSTI